MCCIGLRALRGEIAGMKIRGAIRRDSAEKTGDGYAANRTRTCDMLVNSQPLYQLSYGGTQVLYNVSTESY